MKRLCVVLGSVAALVVIALVVMWMADGVPTYSVEEGTDVLYIRLLRHRAIVDVSIVPSAERVHLDIRYDSGVTRHVEIELHGKPILISPVRLEVTSMSKEFFTDRFETRWWWRGGTPLSRPRQRLYGAIEYVPATDTCFFLEQKDDEGPLRVRWWVRE